MTQVVIPCVAPMDSNVMAVDPVTASVPTRDAKTAYLAPVNPIQDV